jgi:uncharacterized protein with PQ loop repeat
MPFNAIPTPEGGLFSIIAWIYLATNLLRVFTYVPQVVAVWRSTDGALSVSLLTWGSWVVAQSTSVFYGLMIVRDGFFVAIALINLVGCGAVLLIAMRRRASWRQAGEPGRDAPVWNAR